MNKKIAIIGGGNLGTAIAEGLLKSGFSSAGDIIVTKRNIQTAASLAGKGIRIIDNNSKAVAESELIIIAVKPFQVKDVLQGIRDHLTESHTLVSVVTGIYISDIEEVIEKKLAVFRAMPNTAIAI